MAATERSPRPGESYMVPELLLKQGFALPVELYEGLSPRLRGFMMLENARVNMRQTYQADFNIPAVTALTDPLFRCFVQNGRSFPPDVEQALTELFQTRLEGSSTGKLSVRRAFWTPENPDPPGKRFNALNAPEDILGAVKSHFEYAIEQGWADRQDVEVNLNLQDFTDPPNVIIEGDRLIGDSVPYGGDVTPLGNSTYRIQVLPGDSRSVTTERADSIVVQINGTGPHIVDRHINPKTAIWLDRGGTDGELVKFAPPVEMQMHFTPLNEFDAIRLALVAHVLQKNTGAPYRIEFSAGVTSTGVVAPYVNEAQPFILPEQHEPVKIIGTVFARIARPHDVEHIKTLLKGRAINAKEELMVTLTAAITTSPNQLATALHQMKELEEQISQETSRPFKFVFLYPGSKTEHAFKMLATELDMRGYPIVPDRQYKIGDEVYIWSNGIDHRITNLTRAGNKKAVSIAEWPEPLSPHDVGSKAASLQTLINQGESVPKAVVLTDSFFKDVLKKNGLLPVWSTLLLDLPKDPNERITMLKGKFKQIRETLQELPEKDWERFIRLIRVNFNGAGHGHLIVRSSAQIEDLISRSLTGAFLTVTNVRLNDEDCQSDDTTLKEAVLQVMRSPFSDDFAEFICGLKGDEGRRILAGLSMPVLIMQQIESKVSGTIFHMDPVSRQTNLITIQAQDGIGGVVSGEQRKRTLTVMFDSLTGQVLSRTMQQGNLLIPIQELTTREQTLLTEEEAKRLFVSAREVRQGTGEYPDMEWCIGPDTLGSHDQLWYVQLRPLNTSKKEAEV